MATEIQSFYTPSTTTRLASHAPVGVEDLISKYSSTMTSSASNPFVSHALLSPKRRNIVQRFLDRVRLQYYRYEVTFGVYTMTPGEKLAFNSFMFIVLTLSLWALLLYFPSLLYNKLSRVIWLLTGYSGEEMRATAGKIYVCIEALRPSFSPHRKP